MDDKSSLPSWSMDSCRSAPSISRALGHDEEVGGEAGAAAIATALRERGAAPFLVLDEDGAIAAGFLPRLERPIAMARWWGRRRKDRQAPRSLPDVSCDHQPPPLTAATSGAAVRSSHIAPTSSGSMVKTLLSSQLPSIEASGVRGANRPSAFSPR